MAHNRAGALVATVVSVVVHCISAHTRASLTQSTHVEIAPKVFMPRLVMNAYPNTSAWFSVGGRAVDSAFTYTEAKHLEIAQAVRDSGVPRSELFITTKVPCCPTDVYRWPFLKMSGCNTSRDTAADVKHELDLLGVGYVDLLLLHWPCDRFEDTLRTWRAMESFAFSGAARAIGVSNYAQKHIEELTAAAHVKPAVNQCGYAIGSPGNATLGRDKGTINRCRELNITYQAYGAFGEADATAPTSLVDVLHHPTVIKVAQQHPGVSTAQVALKWIVQQEMVVVSSTSSVKHMEGDMQIFDFELLESEMTELSEAKDKADKEAMQPQPKPGPRHKADKEAKDKAENKHKVEDLDADDDKNAHGKKAEHKIELWRGRVSISDGNDKKVTDKTTHEKTDEKSRLTTNETVQLASKGLMPPVLVGFAAVASVVGLGAAVMRRKTDLLEEPLIA